MTPAPIETSPHLRERLQQRRNGGKRTVRHDEVLKAIQEDPGITRGELSDRLKINPSTLRHHLRGLLERDFIKIWKPGGKEFLHPGDLVLDAAVQLRFLRRDEWCAKTVSALCSTADTSTVHATANRLKADFKTVERRLESLEDAGFIRLEVEGRRKRIHVLPDLYRLLHDSTTTLPSPSLTLLHIQRSDRPYPSISDSFPHSGETGDQN